MANKKKQSPALTVVYIVFVLLVLFAVAGFGAYFLRSDDSDEGISLSVTIDGNNVGNGTSVSALNSGSEITVYGVSEFDLAVYAWSSEDNDFDFTVNGEVCSWCDFKNRNLTNGFTFDQKDRSVVISYVGFEQILSDSLNGAEVTVGDLPTGDIFRLSVCSGIDRFDIYFGIFFGITLDKTNIVV